MLLDAKNLSKSIGARYLFQDLSFTIVPGEKIALIGRNGHGKTTLLKILSGQDHDYEGTVTTRKGVSITLTQQEHHDDAQQTPLEYILKSVPKYHAYKKFIDDYEAGRSTDHNRYLRTLEYFGEQGYFHVEDAILSTLADFTVSNEAAQQPLAQLSGGEKRYVEMTRIMFARSDVLLVDEPTNHMDYQGKDRFIAWMKRVPQTVIVVSHDRDVLKNVTKIIELKDQKIEVYKGNYDHYINHNTHKTLDSVKQYTDQLNRLKEAKKKVEWGLQMRAKSKQWKTRYDHWLRDYEKLRAQTVKPSFWIDQDSVESLDKKVVDSYQTFKEKNIKINIKSASERGSELVTVRNLALGYDEPLFEGLSFTLKDGERIFIKGRNGAGKSTLVKTMVALWQERRPAALQLDGEVLLGPDVRIGQYEQEISGRYLSLPLEEAIRACYQEKTVLIDDRQIKSLLAQYLFDPVLDGRQKVSQLSGGQKARFQLIKLLVGEPNFLILDEPTNHLDLPSIEELENALTQFQGGILYISHDTYFIAKLGGKVVELTG